MATKKEQSPELKAIMDRIAACPSLDAILASDPRPRSDENLQAIIERQRADRALFEFKKAKREDKKEGIE